MKLTLIKDLNRWELTAHHDAYRGFSEGVEVLCSIKAKGISKTEVKARALKSVERLEKSAKDLREELGNF